MYTHTQDPATYEHLLHAKTGNTTHADTVLDTHCLKIESLSRHLDLTIADIEYTESFLLFKLDHSRNRLILVDAVFSIISTWLGCALIISGLGGMNLFAGVVGSVDSDDPTVWVAYVAGSVGGCFVAVFLSVFLPWVLGWMRV